MRLQSPLKLAVVAALIAAITGLAACNRPDERTRSASSPSGSSSTSRSTTSSNTSKESVGQRLDDATITTKVKAALLAESNVDGMKINVDTSAGKVTLKGELPNSSQVDRAVQVARSVEGVVSVDNQLRAGG